MQNKVLMPFSLLMLDTITLGTLFYNFILIRFQGESIPDGIWQSLFVPLVITPIMIFLIDGYSLKNNMRSLNYATEHIVAGLAALVCTILSMYVFTFQPGYYFSRMVLPISFLTFIAISLIYRGYIYSLFHKHQKERYFVILGTGGLAKDFYMDCMKSGISQNFRVLDVTKNKVGQKLCGSSSPVIEAVSENQFTSANGSQEAVIVADDRRSMKREFVEKLIRCHFNGVPIISVEKFYENYLQKIPSSLVNPQLLLGEGFDVPRNPVFERIKRLSDIALASIGLILTAPFFLLVPVLIRMGDDDPIIFKQVRTGKDNVPFNCYKFRTMSKSHADSPACTVKSDMRITKAGKWLRYLHLDELPQLWNVLKGDMSMIGPRPEQAKLTKVYEKQYFCYRFRHLVRPGITGWAQVNYKYGEDLNDAIKKFEYDLYYIRHFSIKMDASIVLKTLTKMFMGAGR
jgi:exopolysaccharide biosynthesis polyprenyl glycosylphosphotransferase